MVCSWIGDNREEPTKPNRVDQFPTPNSVPCAAVLRGYHTRRGPSSSFEIFFIGTRELNICFNLTRRSPRCTRTTESIG
jgi:hypothetical protein